MSFTSKSSFSFAIFATVIRTAPGAVRSPTLTFTAVTTPGIGVVSSTALFAASKLAFATS